MVEAIGAMEGRTCVVTGANSGIGKATAAGLARQGAHVVMVCRDGPRGEAAQAEIQSLTGNPSVDLLLADLSSQAAIRTLAAEITRSFESLHVLVNNAGALVNPRKETADGLEYTFALNHLAPFLLTNLLLDILTASAPARVVNVTSGAHAMGRMRFDDLQARRRYRALGAYNQSKLGIILFTYELARRVEGRGVTVNCVHPGGVNSNFGNSAKGAFAAMFRLFKPLMRSPEKGAETVLYIATAPEMEGVTGGYLVDRESRASSRRSYDEGLARQLWDVSAELTGLDDAPRPA
ncbi:MAG: SDR family oxidoreductase [Candidatus Thermoplasmatota archaeon]|nr:SDR family oxidoreductase [Candidatus Thermoplasmatota archaeon]